MMKKSFRTLGRAASTATGHIATIVGAAAGITMGSTIGCAVLARRVCQVPSACPPSPASRPRTASENIVGPRPGCLLCAIIAPGAAG